MKKVIALILSAVLIVQGFPLQFQAAVSTSGTPAAPDLIVTEINPDNSGSDNFEYFEIYNTTNADITPADDGIQLSYIYADSSDTSSDIPLSYDSSAVIPAHTAVVFWLQYTSGSVDSTKYTDADFKNYYAGKSPDVGTDYSIYHVTGQSGMANGGNRGIRISADGTEISRSFYPSRTSTPDSPAQFSLPAVNNSMTLWEDPSLSGASGTSVPTPGTVDPQQIAVSVADTTPPAISNVSQGNIAQGTDAVIDADITDDSQVASATLYYRVADSLDYLSMPMTQQAEDSYQATIPASELWSNQLEYYITATDGTNTGSSQENTVSVVQNSEVTDDQALPPLMITELVPDSTNVNGSDGYEFIELYNNSDVPQSLKDYNILYNYNSLWLPDNRDVTIQPGKTVVLWIKNSGNTDKTVADFNANYGAHLTDGVDIDTITCNGMSNSSARVIKLETNTGRVIDTVSYNQSNTNTDTAPNKGIIYRYDPQGSNTQQMLSSKEYEGTPGTVLAYQVPSQYVQIGEDTSAPAITVSQYPQSLDEGSDFNLSVTARDDHLVKTLTLYYKTNTDTEYHSVNVQNEDQSDDYTATIYAADLLSKTSLTFYLEATDGVNVTDTDPYVVSIRQPESEQGALRTDLNSGAVLSGQFDLRSASDIASTDQLTTAIDGTVYGSSKSTLETTPYFAYDVENTDLYFQNGVTMGDNILQIFQNSTSTWTTYMVPVPIDQFTAGQATKVTVRSGDKMSPFTDDDPNHLNNRDDFSLKNARLILSDGTVICDPDHADPDTVYSMGDSSGCSMSMDFNFTLDSSRFNAQDIALDTTALSDGTHVLTVTDGTNSISRTFVADNTPPVISTDLADNFTLKGEVKINAAITDATSGVASESSTLDGQAIQLPDDVWSGDLETGTHTLVFTATDNAGNTSTKTIQFTVDPEDPDSPSDAGPASGSQVQGTSAVLSANVTDPSADPMQVSFYQGYQYTPSDGSFTGFQNAVESEPPATAAVDGEASLSQADYDLISSDDGQFLTTQSTELPYQRYEVTVSPQISNNDTIQLYWKGKSIAGRRVTLYAWNVTDQKWETIDYKIAGDDEFTLSGNVKKGDYVQNDKVDMLVEDPENTDTSSQQTGTSDGGIFRFAWMTDTQYYAASYPQIFNSEVQYILDRRTADNLQYVIHTGDIVDNSSEQYQWTAANKFISLLDAAGMPYGLLAGNHDVGQLNGDYSSYDQYFGESRYSGNSWYGGSYQDNRGHYDLISADGNDFIIVYMGWGIGQSEYDWMNQVLQSYPDRKAILCFHDYLYTNGLRDAVGEGIYQNVVLKNPNVFLTLNGHYHGAARLADQIDDNGDGIPDRTVYQILADYQAGPEGGDGFIRYLTFDTNNNTLHFSTYSPYLDKENFFDNSDSNKDQYGYQDDFTLPIDLTPTQKMVATDCVAVNVYTQNLIGENTNVPSGTVTSMTWNNLDPNTKYFWYVNVNDNYHGSVTSDIWNLLSGTQDVVVPDDGNNGNPESPVNTASTASNPATGDSSTLDVKLLFLAGTAACFALYLRRKKQEHLSD